MAPHCSASLSGFKLKKHTPYLRLIGELCCVYCECFVKYWPCYYGLALWCIVNEGLYNWRCVRCSPCQAMGRQRGYQTMEEGHSANPVSSAPPQAPPGGTPVGHRADINPLKPQKYKLHLDCHDKKLCAKNAYFKYHTMIQYDLILLMAWKWKKKL